ncbi:hypothetical protein QV06_03805 [Gallibacterium genomosp. 3]|uniref:Uncharacterized protein n=1 Tax=Gallibacterium genomosp. 3 TaxID=505345 RepID=A0A1A7PRB1_9PAST|nr:hypothetical protein [Gallibacterium genomosp. 3]OBX05113.1 hypothetical protein QV06_03805 [Gallibacterium genomosp. 3]
MKTELDLLFLKGMLPKFGKNLQNILLGLIMLIFIMSMLMSNILPIPSTMMMIATANSLLVLFYSHKFNALELRLGGIVIGLLGPALRIIWVFLLMVFFDVKD